jgi:hypothetical protein
MWIANGVIGLNGAHVTNARTANAGAHEISIRLLHTRENHVKVKPLTQLKDAAPMTYAKTRLVAGVIGMIGAHARVRAREEGKRAGGLWHCNGQKQSTLMWRKEKGYMEPTRSCGSTWMKMEAAGGKILVLLFVVAVSFFSWEPLLFESSTVIRIAHRHTGY